MPTVFILPAWFAWAAFFCLGLCSAAAHPIPQPTVTARRDDEINGNARMPKSRRTKLHPVFWMAIALAIVATSCATIPPGSHPLDLGRSQPLKGATQLMPH